MPCMIMPMRRLEVKAAPDLPQGDNPKKRRQDEDREDRTAPLSHSWRDPPFRAAKSHSSSRRIPTRSTRASPKPDAHGDCYAILLHRSAVLPTSYYGTHRG